MKPGTFTQMYVQLVFAVYMKENLLTARIRPRVFEYISGIITEMKHKSLIVNGVQDHIHILLGLNPSVSVSDTVYSIKRNSSIFINQNRMVLGRFSWQEGYSAFTYSRSQLNDVYQYIANQETHHARKSFREEYVAILNKNDVDFDPRFLFDFFEENIG